MNTERSSGSTLTLRVRTFLKFLKKRSQFRCTVLLRSSKLVHVDGKNLTCFVQNLDQNLMNLVLRSENDRNSQKMAKTKTAQKTTYVGHPLSKCN